MMSCKECKTTTTPTWRHGPDGHKTLCNACGIRWKRRKGSGGSHCSLSSSASTTPSGSAANTPTPVATAPKTSPVAKRLKQEPPQPAPPADDTHATIVTPPLFIPLQHVDETNDAIKSQKSYSARLPTTRRTTVIGIQVCNFFCYLYLWHLG
jgi:hypothetical protein